MKQFLKNAHQVYLYLYEKDIEKMNVPKGVIIKDGNEILDESEIFTYKNGSYSAFSNLFRFKLLYMKGGYWCDLDLINLKYLDFKEDYVFVSEPTSDYLSQVPTTCLIKMPKGCREAEKAIELCYRVKKDVLNNKVIWGMGPQVLKMIIDEFKLQKYVKHWNTVCSCHPNDTPSLVNDRYKSYSLLGMLSLVNLSILEGQNIKGLYSSIKKIVEIILMQKHWISFYCEWLFKLLEMIGYQIDYKNKKNYKFFNLINHKFENTNFENSIIFPHHILEHSGKISYNEVSNLFLIFENIYTKNHLDNVNYKMPINFINFKNLVLNYLKKNNHD